MIKRGAAPAYTSSPPSSPAPSPRRPPKKANRKPIIEKEIVGAQAEARKMIAEAEAEAARIIDEAQSQAQELRQKGYDDGFQEGLGQHTEQTTQALMQVEALKEAIEPEYIRLVCACVEKIIGHELLSKPDAIVGIVRNALKDATQQREINVRVHPADADVLRKNNRRLVDVLARANAIEIREDPSVARGGCIIVTELGTIDASLERQLTALETVLEEELVSGDPNADYGTSAEEEEEY